MHSNKQSIELFSVDNWHELDFPRTNGSGFNKGGKDISLPMIPH